MKTGRPPKSIALKRLEGDTRQRGAEKHEIAIGRMWESRRGEPPMPSALRSRKSDDPATKARLKIAREHWQYLVPAMERDGLLSELDQGTLVAVVLAFAGMLEAGRLGDCNMQARLMAEYRQFCDRMGLNESARARLQKTQSTDRPQSTQSKVASFLRKGAA